MAEPVARVRLLRLAPVGVLLAFTLTRLPRLGGDWAVGEPALLLGQEPGTPVQRLVVDLLATGATPTPGLARMVGLLLGLLTLAAAMGLLRRLVGRHNGPWAAVLAGGLLAAWPALDPWCWHLGHLARLAALAGLLAAGERLLTYLLRGGPMRLAAAAALSTPAALTPGLGAPAGALLLALVALAFPNPVAEDLGARLARKRLAAVALAMVWAGLVALELAVLQTGNLLPSAGAWALLLVPVVALRRPRTLAGPWALGLLATMALARIAASHLPSGAAPGPWSHLDPPSLVGLLLAAPGLALVRGRRGPRGTVAATALVALGLAGLLATGLDHRDRSAALDLRRAVLSAVREQARQEAEARTDSVVLVLDRSGRLPDDLPLRLVPPLSAGTVPARLVRGSETLDRALREAASSVAGDAPGVPDLARRSFFVVDADARRPGEALPLRVAPGVPAASLATREGGRPGVPGRKTDDTSTGTTAWVLDPPLPQHGFHGVELELPPEGLTATLVLWPAQAAGGFAPVPLLQARIDVRPSAPQSGRPVLALALPPTDERLLGPPLARLELTDHAPDAVLPAPYLVADTEPPSLLLPGPGHVLDLTAPGPPALQAWFPGRLLRPQAFRLDVELDTPGGPFDLSLGGQVPVGAGETLELRPTFLARTDRWSGPTPGTAGGGWREVLEQGLLLAVRRAAEAGHARWRLHLYWEGGLEAGSTPWEAIRWRAAAGAEPPPARDADD